MAEFPAQLFRMEGDPAAVRGSATGWSGFGAAATAAAGQILSLDTSQFVGSEGDQFRANLNTEMPPHLRITGDAFGQVAATLGTFAGALAGLQDRMRPLAAQAPGLWQRLQAAKIRAAVAGPEEKPAALAALRAAQQAWDACEAMATALRAELAAAVEAAAAAVDRAAAMRFEENPGRWDLVGHARNFVRENKGGLQLLSTGLKVASLVAGVLSFTPLAPIAAPIAVGTALTASAIDLSVYAATGEGDLGTVAIDVGLTLLPFGRIFSALRGLRGLRSTRPVTGPLPHGADPLAAATASGRAVDVGAITPAPVWRLDNAPLYRADTRSPDEIFATGFHPRNVTETDLVRYVDTNAQSAFVGTSRDPGLAANWNPSASRRFQYDVDAPGGVDVNATYPGNIFAREQEVAFPGGIDTRFIRGVRQVNGDGSYGEFIPNPNYNPVP